MTLDEARALPDAVRGTGVYFLWNGDALQYIGCTKNMNNRRYMHECSKAYGNQWKTYNVCVKFDRATILHCGPEVMRDIEKRLIKEFQPVVNKNHK